MTPAAPGHSFTSLAGSSSYIDVTLNHGSPSTGQNFQDNSAITISGKVTYSESKASSCGVKGVTISLNGVSSGTTALDGTYSVAAVSGTVVVSVSSPSRTFVSSSTTLLAVSTAQVKNFNRFLHSKTNILQTGINFVDNTTSQLNLRVVGGSEPLCSVGVGSGTVVASLIDSNAGTLVCPATYQIPISQFFQG